MFDLQSVIGTDINLRYSLPRGDNSFSRVGALSLSRVRLRALYDGRRATASARAAAAYTSH